MEERQLVDRAVSGDQGALTALLGLYGDQVRRKLEGTISRRWQSVLSVDDVMQESYAEVFLDIGRFVWGGEGSFGNWLTTIARNNLTDAVKELEAEKRGGKVHRVEPSDDTSLNLYELVGAVTTTPSREAARHEAQTAVGRAMEQLPEVYRQVVSLYDLEGRTAQEVADALNCSRGAMYMRRKRAHIMLAEIFGTASRFLGASG